MGRGLLAVLGCIALAGTLGCQPLYGSKPERLANPSKKKRPPEPEAAAVEVKYVEECQTNFRDDTKPTPNPGASNKAVAEGDTALEEANRADSPSAQSEYVKLSIEKYRNALVKDPFNQEATLKLAIAYDHVLRKACALSLLKRLAELQGNPRFAKKANLLADQVLDNKSWFKGYRKDAITAVGR